MCLLCAAAAASAANPAVAQTLSGAATSWHSANGNKPAEFFVASFVSPVLFTIPGVGLKIYSYGFFVALALLLAFLVFSVDLHRAGIDIDEYNCFFIFVAGFAIGSKGHLALSAVGMGEELTWNSFNLASGHSFMGSQIGAVSFMLTYIKWNGVAVLELLDVLLPCCLLGHAIGKIGCLLSGDGCYGPRADPATVPWAMSFPNAMVPTRVPVHPTPIYEAFCSFCVFLIARESKRLRLPVASKSALVLVLYGFERVLLEQFRRHPPIELFGGLTEYQMLAVALLMLGASLEAWVRWSRQASKERKRA